MQEIFLEEYLDSKDLPKGKKSLKKFLEENNISFKQEKDCFLVEKPGEVISFLLKFSSNEVYFSLANRGEVYVWWKKNFWFGRIKYFKSGKIKRIARLFKRKRFWSFAGFSSFVWKLWRFKGFNYIFFSFIFKWAWKITIKKESFYSLFYFKIHFTISFLFISHSKISKVLSSASI